MKLSLSLRLFILTAMALLPAFAILVYNEVTLRRSRAAEIHDLALRNGRQAASELGNIIAGFENLVSAVAAVPAVVSQDRRPCDDYLRSVARGMPALQAVLLVDASGRQICGSAGARAAPAGIYPSLVADVVKTGRFGVGSFTPVAGRRPVLPLAAPLPAAEGAPQSVLVMDLRVDWLGERLRERDLAAGSALTIADKNGVIIFRDPQPERFVGTTIPERFQSLVRAEAPGTVEVLSQDGTLRILGFIPASVGPGGLYVSTGLAKSDAFVAIDRATLGAAMLIVAGAVVAFALAWFLGHAVIQRPVRTLLGTVDAWRRGERDKRTGMNPKSGEFEEVGAALDDLMAEVESRDRARAQAEAQRDLLMREMVHRIKNTLSVIQALAGQTLKGGQASPELFASFSERIAALGRTYDVLLAGNWTAASLQEIVATTISPYQSASDTRFEINGPPVEVPGSAAMAFSMAIHELCTNAVKYGALSHENGRVTIDWTVREEDGASHVSLVWKEHDGPPVTEPTRRGFGSRMIEHAFARSMEPRIRLEFAPSGVICRIDIRLVEESATGGQATADAA
jgi:two-component sensor histidine kinase